MNSRRSQQASWRGSFFGTCEAGDYRQCFVEAGRQYGIAPDLLEAMAKVESGYRPDAVNQNSDGSVDVGLLQINSFWYRSLGKKRWMALGDPWYNARVGAWILAQSIQSHGYTWEAVGCYNARSKIKRTAYVRKVMKALNENSYAFAKSKRN